MNENKTNINWYSTSNDKPLSTPLFIGIFLISILHFVVLFE